MRTQPRARDGLDAHVLFSQVDWTRDLVDGFERGLGIAANEWVRIDELVGNRRCLRTRSRLPEKMQSNRLLVRLAGAECGGDVVLIEIAVERPHGPGIVRRFEEAPH